MKSHCTNWLSPRLLRIRPTAGNTPQANLEGQTVRLELALRGRHDYCPQCDWQSSLPAERDNANTRMAFPDSVIVRLAL